MLEFNSQLLFAIGIAFLAALYLASLFHLRYEGTLGYRIYTLMVLVIFPPMLLLVGAPLYSLIAVPLEPLFKSAVFLGLGSLYWFSLRKLRQKLLRQRIRLKEGSEIAALKIPLSDNEEPEHPD